MQQEGLCYQCLIGHLGYWHSAKMVDSSFKMVFGQSLNFEMDSKLRISPYLFNHHYDCNNPKILTPTPQSMKMVHLRLCRQPIRRHLHD